MPRITKVYTKTGDAGETGLGGGQRLAKDALRIEAYGTVDEVNSFLGLALASGVAAPLRSTLETIQNDLFHLGSDLCILEEDKARFKVPQIEPRHVEALEHWIDEANDLMEPLANFILPGGSLGSSHLQVARTVCRRAERLVVGLAREEPIGDQVLPYLNRLSDLFFVFARWNNLLVGVDDVLWDSRA